ncbi:MAG: hypothetical protein ACRYFR_06660 [Janthinobacterium lividum]
MHCTCSQYPPLDLSRASINKRIRDTKAILKPLVLLAVSGASKLKLFQCPQCAQHWQTGWEWGLGGTEYAFQVPPIAVKEWQEEPCGQPAAWMIYTASMQDYYAKNTFEPSDKPCRVAQCPNQAIKLSGVCEHHHIEQLQQFGMLPKRPVGRLFPPYHFNAPA